MLEHGTSSQNRRCRVPCPYRKIVGIETNELALVRRYIPNTECAAAKRATGTRKGEQLT